ncbi:MAG: ABC transporter ATP-binding protein [Planctomycetota bacterium]
MALRVRGLSKRYRIHASAGARLAHFLSLGLCHPPVEIDALRDVSFGVPRGAMTGIIGSNGAGKTTLLRILAGTTSPSAGTVIRHGTVASLLELGIGFHPDFTGRQNILLNASLLGFGRAESRRQTEQVIEFAELAEAIDRPLRTYSSGMALRLGFAVAMMRRPDIMLLDEILAVGDERFQRKSRDLITRRRDQGMTVLLCSHALADLRRHCGEVLWLEAGRLVMQGPAGLVTERYEERERRRQKEESVRDLASGRFGFASRPDDPRVLSVDLLNDRGEPAGEFRLGDLLVIAIRYTVPRRLPGVNIGVAIFRTDNELVTTIGTHYDGIVVPGQPGCHYCARLRIPSLRMRLGEFHVIAFVYDERAMHAYDHAYAARTLRLVPEGPEPGLYVPPHTWSFEDKGERSS